MREDLLKGLGLLEGESHEFMTVPISTATTNVIAEINQVVRGWAGSFHVQHCGRAFSALRRFVSQRVRRSLRRKHRVQAWGYRAFPDLFLYGQLGLYKLPGAPGAAPPASASR